MKKQIIVIHGGDSFKTYKEYLNSLKNWEVKIDYFRPRKDWKTTLQDELGEKFDVLLPRMPNKSNAKFIEWKIWFERMFPFLNKEVILIGHSLGGMFLAKYLSENDFPKHIKQLHLVAAPHNKTGDIADFLIPKSLNRLSKQAENIYFYYSQDDRIVPITEMKEYKKQLPNAQFFIFKDRGHFKQEKFPELIKLLKTKYPNS
ncbi:MAG: alpha/beta fold hydrolase [Candidatus Berkelbacteria bacterium]|nr:alpha/beta fold hydrolase [Candidatus Berkelbacteria bacterium]